jgi:Transcriptional regulators
MQKKAPMYLTIMEIIKEQIIDGKYLLGSLLPTEREFEDQFNVSKITVRKAIELLEFDGYVKKQSGKGTLVINNSIYTKLSKGTSFSGILNAEGFQIVKDNMQSELVEILPQQELFNYFGGEATKIRRVYYLDGKPYIYMEHFLPSTVMLHEKKASDDFSLYMHLYRNNYFVHKFEDAFSIIYPTQEVLENLSLVEGPVLGRIRKTYDVNGRIIEYSNAFYNTRIHPYRIDYVV